MQRQPHNFLEIFKVIDEFDDTESKSYINDDGLDIPKILSDQQYSESRDKVNRALNRLDRLVADDTWDRNIDIVGFSRGASIAREFSNEIFDTVGSIGLPGNHVNIGYAFRVDSRIGHVAHAVALNEHRALFPLTSVSPVEGASLTSG